MKVKERGSEDEGRGRTRDRAWEKSKPPLMLRMNGAPRTGRMAVFEPPGLHCDLNRVTVDPWGRGQFDEEETVAVAGFGVRGSGYVCRTREWDRGG